MSIETSYPQVITHLSLVHYQLLHEIYVLSDAYDRHILKKFGLNISKYRLMMLLHNEKGQRLTTLSERMLVSKSTVTRIVDQLEHVDWVQRIADPEDRRAQRVILTPAGSEQRTMITAAHQRSLIHRMQSLESYEMEQLEHLLRKFRDALRIKLTAGCPDGDSL